MFKEHDINGEQGLVYLLKESEVLQSFHLAMLTTNPQLRAIPIQCTYLEGREAIYFKTGHLISVERYLNENRLTQLSWIMKGLAETVKQLMEYQLFPENMCFDSQHVFIDLSNRKVYLIYLPIKAHIFEAKSKMTSLLRHWLDRYINQSGNSHYQQVDYNPMMMKLILSLQQETMSFSNLLEIMCQLGIEPSEKSAPSHSVLRDYQEEHISTPTTVTRELCEKTVHNPPQNLKETIKSELSGKKAKENSRKEKMLRKPTTKSAKCKRALQMFNGNSKILAIITPVAVAIVGLILSPLALESKIGGGLIVCAGSVWCVQKFKLLQPKRQKSDGEESDREEPKQKLSSSVLRKSNTSERAANLELSSANEKNTAYKVDTNPATGEYLEARELAKSDETLWINPNNKCGVLMFRSELGSKFVTLSKEVTTLGRNPSLCDVLIDEAGVGRIHAEIHMNDDKYYIKDVQSLNGSYVNGKKIPSNQYYELRTGDQIKIGSREVIFT